MPPPRDDEIRGGDLAAERARRGVRTWVRDTGRRTGRGLRRATPYGILALLTASAVAPVASPSLGASGEFAAALDQLGGMGGNYLADVLAGTAARMPDERREPSVEQWRDAVAEALTSRLEASDGEARALRGEVGEVLRAVDAVGVALAESTEGTDELRSRIVWAVDALGSRFDELRWMLTESAATLGAMQEQLATHGADWSAGSPNTPSAYVTSPSPPTGGSSPPPPWGTVWCGCGTPAPAIGWPTSPAMPAT